MSKIPAKGQKNQKNQHFFHYHWNGAYEIGSSQGGEEVLSPPTLCVWKTCLFSEPQAFFELVVACSFATIKAMPPLHHGFSCFGIWTLWFKVDQWFTNFHLLILLTYWAIGCRSPLGLQPYMLYRSNFFCKDSVAPQGLGNTGLVYWAMKVSAYSDFEDLFSH